MAKSFYEDRLQSQNNKPFSVGGKIRVGTKALNSKYAENADVQVIMNKVQKGIMSFRDAEKEMLKLGIKNPFYPRNTQEFHAHPWDMGMGGAATSQRILELYGEKKEGDTKAKLYRFPVVFPEVDISNIDSLLGGGLSVQGVGQNQIAYKSQYGDDGNRYCVYLPPVVTTETSQRKIKQYTRRTWQTRGQCDPSACDEYAMGLCRFSGTLRFYVPEIIGMGIFELHTGSTDAASEIYLRLSQAAKIFAASGKGFQNYDANGNPVWWISKHKVSKPYYDDGGTKKVSEQWVPYLDATVNMSKVIWLGQATRAAALEAPQHTHQALRDDRVAGVSARVMPTPGSWVQSERPAESVNQSPLKASAPAIQTQGQQPSPSDKSPNTDEMLTAIEDHAQTNQYEDEFLTWVEYRFGQDWMNQRLPEVFTNWTQYVERYGAHTGQFLKLLNACHKHGIDPQLTVKYLQVRHGRLTTANLEKMVQEVEAFMAEAGGPEIASEVMKSAVEKASNEPRKAA